MLGYFTIVEDLQVTQNICFFAQFIIEQKRVSDSINIALKKDHGQPVTASHIRSSVQPYRILFVKIRHIYFCDKSLVPHLIGNDLCMKL